MVRRKLFQRREQQHGFSYAVMSDTVRSTNLNTTPTGGSNLRLESHNDNPFISESSVPNSTQSNLEASSRYTPAVLQAPIYAEDNHMGHFGYSNDSFAAEDKKQPVDEITTAGNNSGEAINNEQQWVTFNENDDNKTDSFA